MEEKNLEQIVRKQIETIEKLGDQAGGSGHMGHVSYRIDDIRSRLLDNGNTEISYRYTLMVETEFTCYPDNPPYETPSSGSIILDPNGKII